MVDNCKIFSASSTALKISSVLVGVIFIVQCVGVGTDYWAGLDSLQYSYHSGIWKHCVCYSYRLYHSDDTCVCGGFSSYLPGWLKGVQALELIGLIAIIILGVLLFIQLFFTENVGIKIWTILLTLFAGVSILIGVTVYGVKVNNLHFSFGLCVVAGILCLICAVFLIQDRNIARRNHQRSREQPYNVHYATQGHVIHPPQAQTIVSFTSPTQTPGSPQSFANAQYGPPPSYNQIIQQGKQLQPYDAAPPYPGTK